MLISCFLRFKCVIFKPECYAVECLSLHDAFYYILFNGIFQHFLHDVRFVPRVEETNFVFLCRWFKHASESYVKLPFVGAISYLTLAVTPFCITFAVFWAVYRDKSFSWIGQDILVRINFSHQS